MNKEDFLEEFYYNRYKDVPGIKKKQLERKTGLDCRELYTRIQNYQINKYGSSLAYMNVNTYNNKNGISQRRRIVKNQNEREVRIQNKTIERVYEKKNDNVQ